MATLDSALVDHRLSALLARLGDARPDACCAGAAGAEVPSARGRLLELLEHRLPGCRVAVVHDTRLVLAAAGLSSGIVLIAGTGSVAFALAEDGREARRGGWGWMIGDDGAGVWITREAARTLIRRAEDGEPAGPLGEAMFGASGAADGLSLLARLHAMPEPGQWAALSAAVFATAAADAGAAEIIDRAATELARLVMPLRSLVDGPVVLAGGLLLHQAGLERAVRERIAMRCVRLEQPPVEGAVRLAEGLLAR